LLILFKTKLIIVHEHFFKFLLRVVITYSDKIVQLYRSPDIPFIDVAERRFYN